MIYLDYNASVPLRPQAKEALMAALALEGNPSSPHQMGRKLRGVVDGARKEILGSVGGKRVVFTSGGTEANGLALSGFGPLPVVTSSIEHESVLKGSPSPHVVPVRKDGSINLEELERLLDSFETPGLLSLMLVNNETGVIQPVKEAARLARQKGWKVHTDASQAVGYVSLSFEDLGVDLMTISSHKCGGPIGVGALVMREEYHLIPMVRGGGQEYGMRSGTLPAQLITGFVAAFQQALKEDHSNLLSYQRKIEDTLVEACVYGKESPRTPHTVCLGMPGVSAEVQLMAFDLKGIAVSAGAACSSGTMKTSHVLKAMDIPEVEARCAIRVSMGWKTQEHEIDTFIQGWKNIYSQKFKKVA
jgi:cysteine desulfurase